MTFILLWDIIGYKLKNERYKMTNSQRRTEINKKIKSAKQVYIFNGWAEDYFKKHKRRFIEIGLATDTKDKPRATMVKFIWIAF